MTNLGKMREIKEEEEINEEMFLSCPSKVESLVTPLYFDNKSGKSFQSERSSDLPLSIFFQSANGVYITNMKVTRRGVPRPVSLGGCKGKFCRQAPCVCRQLA